MTSIYYDDKDDDDDDDHNANDNEDDDNDNGRKASHIFVHNHHGSFWHYSGHSPDSAKSASQSAGTSSAPLLPLPMKVKWHLKELTIFCSRLAREIT